VVRNQIENSAATRIFVASKTIIREHQMKTNSKITKWAAIFGRPKFQNQTIKFMKKLILFSLFILSIFLFGCKKDKIQPIFGDYIGQTKTIRSGFEEIFINPSTSSYQFFTTTTITTDTITVSETGDQRFIMGWQFIGFDFSSNEAIKDTVRYNLSIGGGYTIENAVIFFDTDKKSVFYEGTSESQGAGGPDKTEISFLGIKK
jgi:hypothetical protein